jgi:hypothetical protein
MRLATRQMSISGIMPERLSGGRISTVNLPVPAPLPQAATMPCLASWRRHTGLDWRQRAGLLGLRVEDRDGEIPNLQLTPKSLRQPRLQVERGHPAGHIE